MLQRAADPDSAWSATGPAVRFDRLRFVLLFVPVLLLAAACAGSAQSEEAQATLAVAEQNQQVLDLSDDLGSTQLLDGTSGAITTLGDVVTGDRPVLVWYWAPN